MLKKIKNMNENSSQENIVSWCFQNGLVAVAVPNGVNLNNSLFKKYGISQKEIATSNAIQIKKLKKEGLHTGFPDLIIFGENDGDRMIFMENKVKGNKPSEAQKLCHEWLREMGFIVEISENSIDGIKKIKEHFFKKDKQKICLKYLSKKYKTCKRQ